MTPPPILALLLLVCILVHLHRNPPNFWLLNPFFNPVSVLEALLAHRKSWNSWNVCKFNFILHKFSSKLKIKFSAANLRGQNIREAQTIFEDIFIRKFMTATFHSLICSEVIIKRQFNTIRIASIMSRGLSPRKVYFLIGYSEELLSNWLQCPVTLEIQTIADKKEVIFKYI